MAKILIIGASKGIGFEAVKAGLAAGHEVRAFSRSAESMALQSPLLTKVNGDALRPGDIAAALDGVEVVIQSLGVSGAGELVFGTTLFSNATRVLVDAMTAANVRRLIAVTGAGAGDSRGRLGALYDGIIFPLLLKRVYDDKDIAENIIRRSGLDWTIARPGGLTNGPMTGRYRILTRSADWKIGFISRADVADFLIKQVTDRALIGDTPLLVG